MNGKLSFKARIVLVAIAFLTLSLVILSASSYRQLSGLVKANVDDYARLQMTTNGKNVDRYIKRISRGLTNKAPLLARDLTPEQLKAYLQSLAGNLVLENIMLGYQDGRSYRYSHGDYRQDKVDYRQSRWYQQASNKRSLIITDIYQEAGQQHKQITLATPFYRGGAFAGVLAVHIDISELSKFVQQATFPGSIAALYDDTGLTIASTGEVDVPGESRLSDFEPLVELEQIMLSQTQNMHEFVLLEIDKIAYFEAIQLTPDVTWHMLVAIDKSKMYGALDESLQKTVMITLVLIALSALAIFAALSVAYRPLLALKQTISELAAGQGDLTRRLEVTREDDLGEISHDINTFIADLQAMMQEIQTAANNIAGSVTHLQHQSSTNHQVLDAHKLETAQVATALNEMSASSNDVADNTEHAVTLTSKANDQTLQSKQVVADATRNMQQLVEQVVASSGQIDKMGQDIANISAVLNVIGDIAEQTNLLALNAAIEAARAGEQGRGFAVVADEVRALASRTQESTSEVHNTINRLNASSQGVITGIEDTKTSCEEAAAQTHRVMANLDQIAASVEDINELNIRIATASQQQSATSDEINRNMVAISDMVDDVAHSGDEVVNTARSLAEAQQTLSTIVGRFKL